MPLPSKRNTPGLGSAFADVETTQLNLFFADTVAHAIETLGKIRSYQGHSLARIDIAGAFLRVWR